MDEIRRQHYLFAHRLLPDLFFEHGADLLVWLGDQAKGAGIVQSLWERAARGLPCEECVTDGVPRYETFETEAAKGAIVILPEPKGESEAHMVALASSQETPDLFRVFTLERGGNPRDVLLCEWTASGAHMICEHDLNTDLHSFAVAVSGRMSAKSTRRGESKH